jgi:Holliday junction resolvase RusA-like endonuclease
MPDPEIARRTEMQVKAEANGVPGPPLPFRVEFFVNGIPKGQPRGRAFVTGGRARIFTPGTAEAWKGDVARAAAWAAPAAPLTGPVRVDVAIWLPRPKRLMRKGDPDRSIWCTAKPDCDNLAKAILDALTVLGFWRDDAQVCAFSLTKSYHGKTPEGCGNLGRPGARIAIEDLSG